MHHLNNLEKLSVYAERCRELAEQTPYPSGALSLRELATEIDATIPVLAQQLRLPSARTLQPSAEVQRRRSRRA